LNSALAQQFAQHWRTLFDAVLVRSAVDKCLHHHEKLQELLTCDK